ncbi:fumarylacetoacetate (FAA) hydrolase family protein [Nocardia nova SH22a]|uniref:Fumarylacetoacetate (FAA) hydrolase family protein n=1 Tax=Nocardia nova SH22a TaxID=1415166 RepID=W5TMM0_9NOCA|nr:fumarylacetoacetate hydrolase family protein [Nocardia nova]AHH18481.1 fumarylacetoacetate (FAA) hydrolase family protein [Nocardia nova SH22a]
MTTTILRTIEGWWVARDGLATRIETGAVTTAELLADRRAIDAAAAAPTTMSVAELLPLSPVTTPCRVVAQMTNYASHARDAGMDPDTLPLTFFRKSSGSISGPTDDIVKPTHVQLLDYEVELGLVLGAPLPVGSTVTDTNWTDYIAGLVVTNDISARDVQLTKTQFYEAKSYPGFTPVGPALVLLDRAELARFGELRLRLSVNGHIRQDALIGGDIIYRPAQALQALTRFQHLDTADLLLTGTPIGTALSAPPKPVQKIAALLPDKVKWKLFFRGQTKNPDYLNAGDIIEASIATDDNTIDLGTQRTMVKFA